MYLQDGIVYDRLIRNMRFLGSSSDKSNDELFHAALEMRLHLGDEVVKRRLIGRMKKRLLVANPPLQVTTDQIATEFITRKTGVFSRTPVLVLPMSL